MKNRSVRVFWIAAAAALLVSPAFPQNPANKTKKHLIVPGPPAAYRLGPGDQIQIWALGLEEAGQHPIRIDPSGFIEVPMIGRVKAQGLTSDQLRQTLADRMKTYVKQPQVTVSITDYGSQPVSVIGSVNKAGVEQLQGPKTLIEVLSMAGGLSSDSGNTITVTRPVTQGEIPLPRTKTDRSGQFTTANIPVEDLFSGTDPSLNIPILPHDVISVARGHVVYVLGEVKKPGGFNIGERPHLSVLEALSLAEGPTSGAATKKARILRQEEGVQRKEIPVDASKILSAKAPDIALEPGDILLIPVNQPRNVAIRALETAVNIGSGIAIFRVGYPVPH
ncbi:MAG TPA: polysaccharide biosynthesis/export family protein [Bryobacteraceae bacterium]|nr:polysaccharide biosynthesis/export family protein [Bryobacteraceae bacterium]